MKRVYRILLTAFMIIVIATVIQLLMLQFVNDNYLSLIVAEMPSFFIGLVLIYFWLEKKYIFSFREMGFNSTHILRYIFLGITIGLIVGFLVVFFRNIMGYSPSGNISNLFLVLSVSCIVAPLFEELIFRGLLFNFFMRFFPLFKPIELTVRERWLIVILTYILVSMMFASSHMRIPEVRVVIFMTSFIYTYIYHKTGNITTPIVAHSIYNLVVIMV